MWKKSIIGVIVVVFFVAIVIVAYSNIKQSVTKEDITVEAILQINNTTHNEHKEYLMDINIIKNKDSHISIYPYIEGLGMMTFSDQEEEGYFVPGSIGSDGITEPTAITELRNNNLIYDAKDVSLVGFWFPDEAGQYKARIYLDKFDSFKEIKNPVLVCVYLEEKYGRKLMWSKIVPVTFN
jgi:hypothetical protein